MHWWFDTCCTKTRIVRKVTFRLPMHQNSEHAKPHGRGKLNLCGCVFICGAGIDFWSRAIGCCLLILVRRHVRPHDAAYKHKSLVVSFGTDPLEEPHEKRLFGLDRPGYSSENLRNLCAGTFSCRRSPEMTPRMHNDRIQQ